MLSPTRKSLGLLCSFLCCASMWLGVSTGSYGQQSANRPNMIVILVDDMGWSDLGCYGGDVDTPNLNRLATEGLRFTQFYNCAKCETTRATLLTGRYHPEVQVTRMARAATLAEVAAGAGYQTWMTGKWHLNQHPMDRGFERYFGHLSGATNFFRGDQTFRLDREKFEVPESGFYTTDANTDYAIQFLKERDKDQPFLLYLAYNAPHYPLQAPREDVMKYLERYRGGWDALREARLARQKELGLVDSSVTLPTRPDDVPAWDSLNDQQRERESLVMAAYAAMIDRIDQNIGRLTAALQSEGVFDDTLILFLSDNGACPFQRTKQPTLDKGLMPWDPDSYWTYDRGWAHACNTPFREYKRNQHEGGINTPLIVSWPNGIKDGGRIVRQPGHIVDVMATLVDVGEAAYPPKSRPGALELRGESLVPIFNHEVRAFERPWMFTYYGTHNAIRLGDWKLVNRDDGPWELYRLDADPNELHDLIDEEAEQAESLLSQFEDWSQPLGLKRRARNQKPAGGQQQK